MSRARVEVNDLMQQRYVYVLAELPGKNFHPIFRPQLTPMQMLELGIFGGKSKPLSYWRQKGWIYHQDPRGWFQWYCRYYRGRRCPDDDRQINRWIAFRRHIAQIRVNCHPRDLTCRPKQRQALLHWAYDSRML